MNQDTIYMQQALAMAKRAAERDEVPVGAVAVINDEIISHGWNCPITSCDPTAHAEIIALRNAALLCNNYRLTEVILYVTLEPCAMCIGAMLHARIKRLVFGAADPKTGAVISIFNLLDATQLNHKIPYTSGILAPECGKILSEFFQKKRR